MEIKNLEECKQYAREKIENLRPVFAKAAIGDFSSDIQFTDNDDDEFMELYVGIRTILEVVQEKIKRLEEEAKKRQETEERLVARNKELMDNQKALVNLLEDLEKAKTGSISVQVK